MTNMQDSIERDAIIEVTIAVWESLLGTPPSPTVSSSPPPESASRSGGMDSVQVDLVGRVDVSGSWRGDVAVQLPCSLALRLTRAILRVDPTTSDDADVRDVVGELANMIGGNLKALLPEPCKLSLPTVARAVAPAPGALIQTFTLGEDTFEVRVTGAHAAQLQDGARSAT